MDVILISGKQGAGKTTLARYLRSEFEKTTKNVNHVRLASILYDMHHAVYTVLGNHGMATFPIKEIDGDLLQLLGTEWGRKKFGEDVWVKACAQRLEWYNTKVAIIDDARFPNELSIERYLSPGARVFRFRLEADESIRKLRAEKWRENTGHPSEVALDDYYGWHAIFNTNSMQVEEYATEILRITGYDAKPA